MADVMFVCPQCGKRTPQPSWVESVWCTGVQHAKRYSVRMNPASKSQVARFDTQEGDKNAQA